MASHDLHVVKTLDGFLSLKNEWNALWEQSSQLLPYQKWEWNYHWMRTGSNWGKIYLLVVRSLNRELLGIAPLCLDRPLGVMTRLSFIGQRDSVYPNFLIQAGQEIEVIRAFLSHLRCTGIDTLELVVAEPTAVVSLVENIGKVTGWVAINSVNYTKRLIVNLSEGYDTYMTNLGSRMRQEIRAETRKLEKLFALEFSAADSDGDLEERMNILLRLNSLKWNADPERSHLERRECYRVLYRSGEATIFLLTCNGKPVGALSALLINGTLFAEIAGFDYSIARVDIGKVFYHFLFQWATAHGFREVDFSSGEEPYKFRYKPEVWGKWRLTLYRNDTARRLLRLNAVCQSSIHTIKHRIACSGAYRLLCR